MQYLNHLTTALPFTQQPYAAPVAVKTLGLCLPALGLNYLISLQSPLALVLNTLFLSLTLFVLYPKLRAELRLVNALSKPQAKLSISELTSLLSEHKAAVYLGTGFELTPQHTRTLYEMRRLGFLSMTGLNRTGHGSPVLQHLEQRLQPLWLNLADLNGHTMLFGTTGSGKTTAFALLCCQAILRGDCVIVLDPKHDRTLQQHLVSACERYRPGHFRLFCPHDEESCAFDLLAVCENANQIATRIVSQLPGGGSASSFKAYAHQALSVACKALILNHRKITPHSLSALTGNLEALRRELVLFLKTRSEKPEHDKLKDYLKKVFNKSFPKYETLKGLLEWSKEQGFLDSTPFEYAYVCDLMNTCYGDSNYYAKVTQGILPFLTMLNSGRLGRLLSSQDSSVLSCVEILRHNLVFYAALDTLSDPLLGQTLGRILLSQLSASAGRRYKSDEQPQRVSVFIDEASEVVSEELIQLLNKARGAGFAITIATQTLADFETRSQAPGLATQILGNCNNLISLRVIDSRSKQAVCARLPKTTLLKRSSSLTVSDAKGDLDGMRDTVSRQLSEASDPLFPEDCLGLLPDLEYVAALSDGRCLKGCIPYLKAERQAKQDLPLLPKLSLPGARAQLFAQALTEEA
ncbi:MAG: type IV secretion system DNA-binding domain-containing protein [Succinivibrio sp.]|nr:type IV secretion system DNA-binding domain-containing protein [Succinivibrio sp.]